MPSPFPGMNPYLEQDDAWEDFHQSFLPQVRSVLAAQTGPNYIVKIEERLYIHDLPEGRLRYLGRADVSMAPSRPDAETTSETAVLEAPVQVWLPAADVERSGFLEIRDRRNRQLITTIELLSPSNKRPGEDRKQYLSKRDQLLHGSAHFVEIDLLRGFERMPMSPLSNCAYCVIVSRVKDRPRAGLWPLQLRDPLPLIPIPLRSPDEDLKLNLQDVLHRVYDAAGYQNFIYESTPEPPLSPEEETWARQVLATARVGSPY